MNALHLTYCYYDMLLHLYGHLYQVDYDRTEMLNHNLVQTWIDHKLKNVVPELIIYLALYLLFLANLTVFTLLLPRPGPLNENCKLSMHVIQDLCQKGS